MFITLQVFIFIADIHRRTCVSIKVTNLVIVSSMFCHILSALMIYFLRPQISVHFIQAIRAVDTYMQQATTCGFSVRTTFRLLSRQLKVFTMQ